MNQIPVAGIIQVVIGVFFVGVGMFYVIYPETITILSPMITRILGFLFLSRGIFRIYMVYKSRNTDDF